MLSFEIWSGKLYCCCQMYLHLHLCLSISRTGCSSSWSTLTAATWCFRFSAPGSSTRRDLVSTQPRSRRPWCSCTGTESFTGNLLTASPSHLHRNVSCLSRGFGASSWRLWLQYRTHKSLKTHFSRTTIIPLTALSGICTDCDPFFSLLFELIMLPLWLRSFRSIKCIKVNVSLIGPPSLRPKLPFPVRSLTRSC